MVCVALPRLVQEQSQLRLNENFVNIDSCGLRLQPSNCIASWCHSQVIGFAFFFLLQLKLTEIVVISEIWSFLCSILFYANQVDVSECEHIRTNQAIEGRLGLSDSSKDAERDPERLKLLFGCPTTL